MPQNLNLSSKTLENLKIINRLNKKILLTPLSPKQELNLRWQAQSSRLKSLLSLEDTPINTTHGQTVLLKKSFTYLRQNWLVNPKPVDTETVKFLHKINHLKIPTLPELEEISQIISNIQTQTKDPILRAALTPAYLSFTNINNRIARILSYLFLYQQGLNFKDFLVLESCWLEDFATYRQALQSSNTDPTPWIEYFTQTLVKQLKKINKQIKKPEQNNFQNDIHLKERHKQIINFLDQPQTIISNKKVQNLFQVSQITASRDLAALARLNLIQSHGRGRSIYYTINP